MLTIHRSGKTEDAPLFRDWALQHDQVSPDRSTARWNVSLTGHELDRALHLADLVTELNGTL